MSGGNRIRVIGPEQPETADTTTEGEHDATSADGSAAELDVAASDDAWYDEQPTAPRSFSWLIPAAAVLAIAAWTGFYGWAWRTDLLAGLTPQQGIEHVGRWSLPTLLVLAIWLLASRNSRREADRFGQVALSLREESIALEERLSATNRELSLAREFLAAQSRELESLGRIAGERLSTHANKLQSLVQTNGEQVEAIATVSTAALENMGRLRDDLPVIANSARDVSNNIGAAGRTAHGQIAELVSGFERLNQFGQASERQVGALQVRVDAALAAFEAQLAHMGDLAATRFDALRENSDTFRADLDGREVEALAALRRRTAALEQEIAASCAALEQAEQSAIESMRSRLTALMQEGSNVSAALRNGETLAGEIWAEQITALHQRLVAAIDEIKSIDDAALQSANRKLDALRQEAESVDRNIAERDARLFSRIMERQAALARTESQSLDALQQRLETLDALLADRTAGLMEQTEALGQQGQAVADRLWELRADMRAIAAAGEETENRLAASIASLAEKLAEGRHVLDGTSGAVADLTEASVRLLELIQASSQHSRNELPTALEAAETRLAALREQTATAREDIAAAASMGADLSAYVIASRDDSIAAVGQLSAMQTELAAASAADVDRLSEMRDAVAQVRQEVDALSGEASGALRDAITLLEQNARSAVGSIDTAAAQALADLAATLTGRSQEAIRQALAAGADGALAELEQVATRAASAGREATVQLRDQLARVNELAGNLESRVARARDLAEQQVDRDFVLRVALISEALNSTAIDIAKILATDVSDTAWTSYLRGDRGIFTRRAVRLLDNTEAREVAELFDADPEFRENVSRYIADFENMLRTLLSTRDGKAVSVTLLSSDMGKLYVALAQAIERLRA